MLYIYIGILVIFVVHVTPWLPPMKYMYGLYDCFLSVSRAANDVIFGIDFQSKV